MTLHETDIKRGPPVYRSLLCRDPPSFIDVLYPGKNQMKNRHCAERKVVLNNLRIHATISQFR